jgi:LAS superfamily LD-carboxypeptidase LdcB
MKTILAILTFLLSTLSYSQYSELSGISLHATGYVTDIEASSEDPYPLNSIKLKKYLR